MKTRNGFVSNSSSSSFVLRKDDLTVEQLDKIFHHIENINMLNSHEDAEFLSHIRMWDKWKLTSTQDFIIGETNMNNFPMETFLRILGIEDKNIFWDSNPYRL